MDRSSSISGQAVRKLARRGISQRDARPGVVRIETRRRLAGGDWGLNAVGVLRKTPVAAPEAGPAPEGAAMEGRGLYASLAGFGLDYGPVFRRVSALTVGELLIELNVARFLPGPLGRLGRPLARLLRPVLVLVIRRRS